MHINKQIFFKQDFLKNDVYYYTAILEVMHGDLVHLHLFYAHGWISTICSRKYKVPNWHAKTQYSALSADFCSYA